jgi:hypothetical protein
MTEAKALIRLSAYVETSASNQTIPRESLRGPMSSNCGAP